MLEESKEIDVNGVKNKIVFPSIPSRTMLEKLFDTCNELFKDKEECFYTHDELIKMKDGNTKIFLP